jgi:hypothetical protein
MNMRLRTIIIGTVVLSALFAGNAAGQLVEDARMNVPTATNTLGTAPAATPFSLLDFSRIKWSHSYSVSFFSGGGESSSLALANTSMFYEISSKLSLQVDLGILHNPGALWGNAQSGAEILPAFRLDYRPSENVRMSINFQRYTGGYLPLRSGYRYGNWGTGYGYGY